MTDTRPITYIRFVRPVSLGSADRDEWSAESPASTALIGAIKPRMGDPDKGEPRDAVIFEVRQGSAAYDVEVPRSNIAAIRRNAPEAKPAATAGKK